MSDPDRAGAGVGPPDVDAEWQALALEVARRYYLRDESKSQIGGDLGISRFKVARLLQQARSVGLVRIEIVDTDATSASMAEELRERYRLRRCLVATSVPEAAARLLRDVLTPADILGLPWSRTVNEVVQALDDLPAVPVVQLSGALIVPGENSSVETVRHAAQLAGGEAHVFYSPMVLSDETTAAAMRQHADVADALRHVSRVSTAVVSIGAWSPGASTIFEAVDERTQREIARLGVVGEVAGIFFTAAGEVIQAPLSARMVTIDGPSLAAIPDVIGLARGADRAEATDACLRSGLVGSLVVDSRLGQRLLALPPRG